jgi:hypothetical protein
VKKISLTAQVPRQRSLLVAAAGLLRSLLLSPLERASWMIAPLVCVVRVMLQKPPAAAPGFRVNSYFCRDRDHWRRSQRIID